MISYINAEQLIGRDKIPVPKTPEEWDKAYKMMGKPDSAELYVLPIKEDVDPKLKELFEKDAKWFRGKAHELGLNEKQATDLFSSFAGKTSDTISNMQAMGETEKNAGETQLRSELGNQYEGKMVLANRAMLELGGKELTAVVDATGVGNNPTFIKAFIKMGEMMAEDLGIDKDTGVSSMSKETVQEQITNIQKTPDYLDAGNPGHTLAVSKVAKLMEQLYGNKTTRR